MTIEPKTGTTAGGTSVKISGGPWDEETVRFTTVMFGDRAATKVDVGEKDATSDDYITYKSIKATSPPHRAGPVRITVITPGNRRTTEKDSFTYSFVVSKVTPPKGKVTTEGDTVVIITGNDLADVDAVEFGGKRARFGLINPSHIWAIVPYSETLGAVPVKVKTSRGENSDTSKFEYTT
jgi:hypothetical protein